VATVRGARKVPGSNLSTGSEAPLHFPSSPPPWRSSVPRFRAPGWGRRGHEQLIGSSVTRSSSTSPTPDLPPQRRSADSRRRQESHAVQALHVRGFRDTCAHDAGARRQRQLPRARRAIGVGISWWPFGPGATWSLELPRGGFSRFTPGAAAALHARTLAIAQPIPAALVFRSSGPCRRRPSCPVGGGSSCVQSCRRSAYKISSGPGPLRKSLTKDRPRSEATGRAGLTLGRDEAVLDVIDVGLPGTRFGARRPGRPETEVASRNHLSRIGRKRARWRPTRHPLVRDRCDSRVDGSARPTVWVTPVRPIPQRAPRAARRCGALHTLRADRTAPSSGRSRAPPTRPPC
jgi:hypothetical protein